jgi:alkylated DNA repair dioxygenase AlkB
VSFDPILVSKKLTVARSGVKADNVPGLTYVEGFLTEADESKLVGLIDAGEWSNELKRRVQQFGWQYDYKSRELDSSMRLGPLPDWALALAHQLRDKGLLPHTPDQVIVNEYLRNQGIAKHIDCVPCFADGIAMVSLLESWEMVFRHKGGQVKVKKILERGSVAIMSGQARYEWSHEIAPRYQDSNGKARHRRISITLRKVKGPAVREELQSLS